MDKTLAQAVAKLEAQLKVRDLVLKNVFEAIVGEEAGQAYLTAVQQADAQVEAALAKIDVNPPDATG